MSLTFSAEIKNLEAVKARVERLSPRKQRAAWKRAFRLAAWSLSAHVASTKLSGSPIKRRSGHLAQSLKPSVSDELGLPIGVVRLGGGRHKVKYARILERGGTIKPTRAKKLTIPLPRMLTGSGVLRAKPRNADSLSFIKTGSTFIRRSKRGNLILFGRSTHKRAKNVRLIPLFVLKDEVRIKGRWFMKRSLKEHKKRIVAVMHGALRTAIEASKR